MRQLTATLVLLALVTTGCARAAGQSSVDVSCDDFTSSASITRTTTLPEGDSLIVSLCSNPSTGFGWEEASISDGTVIQQVDHKTEPSGSSAVGSPGKESWTFKALKKGKTSVSSAYSRPWQGGEKGVRTFRLDVEVK